MNSLVTALRKSFDTVLSELVALQTATLGRANAEREEMLALVARMQETKCLAHDISDMCAELVEEFTSLGEDSRDLHDKISDALDEPEEMCPTVPYEDLAGFCSECGAEILYTDNYDYDEEDNTYLCANCMPATIELAESVAGA